MFSKIMGMCCGMILGLILACNDITFKTPSYWLILGLLAVIIIGYVLD